MDLNAILKDFVNPVKNRLSLENYLGWGDPFGGVWFVGIEEAFNWGANEYKTRASLNLLHQLMEKGKQWDYDHTKPNELEAEKPWFEKQRLKYNIVKLCRDYCEGTPPTFEDYFSRTIFREGSKVFACNLFPIGKPRTDLWNEANEKLYGISAANADRYYKDSSSPESPRGKALRLLLAKSQPQAVICHGKRCRRIKTWDVFQKWFRLGDQEASVLKKITVFNKTSVDGPVFILTPHLSYASDSLMSEIKSVLNGRLKLPRPKAY